MYTLLIVFFFVSIIFSFLCSIWEAVLLSITPSFTEARLQEGGELGDTLVEFKKDIDRPLSAILTLNTIAHTVGAIGVGAQATAIWGASITATLVVPVVMTLAILLLSEIIPKTIGANYWQELAGFTVRSLKVVMKLLAPLVFVSQIITRTLKKEEGASVLSRADLSAMADLGEKEGVLHEDESNIMRNLIKFESIRARDVMTPRTVVIGAPQLQSVREFYTAHQALRFSRVPVFEESLDHVTGYVLKDDILVKLVEGQDDTGLASLRRDLMAVKEDFPITELLRYFTSKHEQMALVLDPFGGMSGLVTMEDVIETLLGMEIVDESDTTVDMQSLARRKWEERARRIGLLDSLDEEIAAQAAATDVIGSEDCKPSEAKPAEPGDTQP